MKYYDYDIALIMKKVEDSNGLIGFVPIKVVEGYYDNNDMCFVDFEGTPYYHIIDEVESYGYFERESFNKLKELYPRLSSKIIKLKKLIKAKASSYVYIEPESTEIGIPFIGEYIKDANDIEQIFDGDIINYYYTNYPDYFNTLYNNYVNVDKNENSLESNGDSKPLDLNLDIDKIYKEVISRVIDQDEPIKKILTAIWKQYNDFSENKSRNILINGSTGVGKTETFRVLSKLIDVPCVVVSATEYSATGYVGKNVEDMLVDLVKKADGDIKKAQNGILVIDEIDKISSSNSERSQVNQRDVQEALLKILEDGVFNIEVGQQQYQFDTSKLLVVGMGSWSRIDLTPKTSIGFGSETVKKSYKDITREDIVANGLIPELVARFSLLVQMNELNYESFVRILKSKNNTINLNKNFLQNIGVELVLDDNVIESIAKIAEKNNYGARGLDEIIERILSVASFEIAINPDKYSKLIITEDTIMDNSKYVLIEKNDVKKLCKTND